MVQRLNRFFKAWFGDFTKEELKKFVFLGIIFAFVIGIYWTLRPMKDSIFGSLVHNPADVLANSKNKMAYVPWAKILSLIILFPLVIGYSSLVERFKRHHLFYIMGGIYFLLSLAFGAFFYWHPTIGLENTVGSPYRIIGWLWYVFVESYGSLIVTLFWAFATDTCTPQEAAKGFGLTVMIGQLGSIFGPMFLTPLGEKYFGNSGPTVLICAALILIMLLAVGLFVAYTPKSQLTGFHAKNEEKVEGEQEPGFFEGLQLILKQPYLLGIFGVIAIYEIVGTIFDYAFKGSGAGAHQAEAALTKFFGEYAVAVNVLSFLFLLFGVNNIQRYLGARFSLALVPILIAIATVVFLTYDSPYVLFFLMVAVKAISYAINSPVMKQLYVPTTKDVKYKSQAWIETFGSRSAKASGSLVNIIKTNLGNRYFLMVMAPVLMSLLTIWFFIARFLGKTYQTAVDQKKVVC